MGPAPDTPHPQGPHGPQGPQVISKLQLQLFFQGMSLEFTRTQVATSLTMTPSIENHGSKGVCQ